MSLLSRLCHRYEDMLRRKTCTPEAFSFDYARIVPGIARLPQPFADPLSRIRARFNACLRRNVLDRIITEPPPAHERVVEAARLMAPLVGRSVDQLVYDHLYQKAILDVLDERIAWPERFKVEWTGHVPQPDGCPHLWVGVHWSMSIPGFAFIASRRGKKVNAIASAAPVSDTMPAGSRAHFNRLHGLLENTFNGGRMLYQEHATSQIATAFKQREDMVALFDLPAAPTSRHAMYLPFFGQQRAFVGGALKRARQHDYRVQPYWVDYLGWDRVRVWCGEPVPARQTDEVEAALRSLLALIECSPEKWFIFEQLPFFPVRP